MNPLIQEEYAFSFVLGDTTHYVRNEDELALILELLCTTENTDALQWNVIMALDEKLLQIIQTYRGLSHCLKYLGFRNRFLLLVKIGDILSDVLVRSEYLGSILAGIPEEKDKIRLIKIIRRKGLVRIIGDANDLGNVLEWVYGDAEKLVIDTLGKEFLRSIFASGRDIYKVFHFLNDENKNYFADLLTIDFLRSLVRTADDFFYTLKALSNTKCQGFIPLFSAMEIRELIKHDAMFHGYLKKITYQKEDFLLKHLGYTLTPDGWIHQ